jgi:hypothetical protein
MTQMFCSLNYETIKFLLMHPILQVSVHIQHLLISKCMNVNTVCTQPMPIKDLRNDNDLFGG